MAEARRCETKRGEEGTGEAGRLSVRGILLAYSLGIAAGMRLISPQFVLPLSAFSLLLVLLALLARSRCSGGWRLALGLLAAGAAGLAWHCHWAQGRLQDLLPRELEGEELRLSGRIQGFVRQREPRQGFEFLVQAGPPELTGRRLSLNHYGEEQLVAGQRLTLLVRLRRPHGFANPGSFDYEARQLQAGIAARGYVRELIQASAPEAGPALDGVLLHLRRELRDRLRELPGLRHGPVLQALILGEQGEVSSAQWQIFNATGSSHLFVISGLHVGLVAFSVYLLVMAVGPLLPLWLVPFRLIPPSLVPSGIKPLGVLPLPRPQAAALAALLAALGYCLLSGFALPAQRAFTMLACLMAGRLMRRSWPVSLRYLAALALVLTLNPLAPLNAGFWFSFLVVGWLLLFVGAAGTERAGKQWQRVLLALRSQCLAFIGLLVPLSQLTGQVSLIAPLVNLLAIPVVGMLIVPMSLSGSLLLFIWPALGAMLLGLADQVLHPLLVALAWSAGQPVLLYSLPASGWGLLLGMLACLLLSLPRQVPGRILALALLLPLLWPEPRRPEPGSLEVQVLDVGQGLAVLLHTHRHTLVYDAGDRFSEDFDLGAAVVAPALRQFGRRRIDRLVISHGDSDHAGGLGSLLREFEVASLLLGGANPGQLQTSDSLHRSQTHTEACRVGQEWMWDGVRFQVLAPGLESAAGEGDRQLSENDLSCVLRVSVAGRALLLPGDIHSTQERALVLAHGDGLRSDILIAPHHGSQTSSSWAFLKRVAPRQVMISAGYRNAFGHPAAPVLGRYAAFDAEALVTANSGMISFTLEPGGTLAPAQRFRRERARYWREPENPL